MIGCLICTYAPVIFDFGLTVIGLHTHFIPIALPVPIVISFVLHLHVGHLIARKNKSLRVYQSINSLSFCSSLISISCVCLCYSSHIFIIASMSSFCWCGKFTSSFLRKRASVALFSTYGANFSVFLLSICAADLEKKSSSELSEVSDSHVVFI